MVVRDDGNQAYKMLADVEYTFCQGFKIGQPNGKRCQDLGDSWISVPPIGANKPRIDNGADQDLMLARWIRSLVENGGNGKWTK